MMSHHVYPLLKVRLADMPPWSLEVLSTAAIGKLPHEVSTEICTRHIWRAFHIRQGMHLCCTLWLRLTETGAGGRSRIMITGRTIFFSYYTPSP
jgi:hypothetical protein